MVLTDGSDGRLACGDHLEISGMMETWSAWKELVGLPMAAASGEMSWIGGAVAGIFVWVITTPLRNVSWAFLGSVPDGGHAVYFFWYTCGDHYLGAARSPQALALPPVDYACALVTLAFLIPIAVLRDYETRTGRLCLKWCEAFHHSCCLFVPDAIQLLWVSSCKYARATGEAVVAVIDRTGDFIVGTYLLASLLLSILIYLPRLVYESVEGVLCGWMGVGLIVLIVDVYLDFTIACCYWNAAVLLVGCYSHLMQCYEKSHSSVASKPGQATRRGWEGLAGCIGRREERERASVDRLRGMREDGTSAEAKIASPASVGMHQDRVPAATAEGTVRPAADDAARRGRRASVGENCHGPQLDGGLEILADCIQKVCSLQTLCTTSNQLGHPAKSSAFQV
ncbi:hypothetical protein PC129_g11581 [Phytophthora cactorum]|uniref:Uncharacterized protein n=1 Tax=Phytophthora cactorum TaxID=29920 RepID=A0A8T1KL57_9STRA|nr:hypothetical protein Pcac1_g1524 [Phytophthora cactorum]KAG2800799.1 hypothetical protein PC112_g20319 [Phytophthora cactorum]KAG2899574.1 hypothetical protein PC114_g13884 [Phytophthora cactorum]KAG2900172.1 hypothetical protein PC117_g22040 [Phytophthora cactorum]KAG2912394.1 hypothetical protein PC115_g12326 [Phytophthora cactorum]